MVLVTGGTGLVGSHLLYHLLQDENSIIAIHQKTSDLNAVKNVFSFYNSDFEPIFNKIIWVLADVNNIPALEHAFKNVKQVYHCAAFVSFNPADYKKMRRVNIEGTTNIVNLCISNKVEKLCYVSSIAAIEKNIKNQAIDESENWNSAVQKSGYAITKYGGEMEVWRASQEGIPVVIVNPGVILGSGFWHKGSSNLFTKINNGFNFYTEGVTGFVGVKDVVQVMLTLMHSNIKNERFILISENLSFKELFNQIADVLNKKRPKFKVSKFLSGLIWRLDWIKSKIFRIAPLITKNSASASQAKKYYTANKLNLALNYKFKKIETVIFEIGRNFNQT